MTQMLFYENPKPLSPALHTGLSIKQDRARFKFAKRVNSVLCAGVEFAEIAYPTQTLHMADVLGKDLDQR